jgi:hypothetical protein
MTDLDYDSFPNRLRATVPGFDRVYDEHVADHGEVLPHVLLGDLVRFLLKELERHGTGSAALKQAMLLLEGGMGSSDERVQDLVAVSFLENLDPAEPGFPTIRTLFGPRLEQQYREYEKIAGRDRRQ